MRQWEKCGKWTRAAIIGSLCGLLNGLFGAGGGMAAVPLLRAGGLEQKKAHATSLAVMAEAVSFSQAAPYLPGGFVGACAGALLMNRIPSGMLRRVFGGLLIFAGVRLLLR